MSVKRTALPAIMSVAFLWSSGALAGESQDVAATFDISKINQALSTAISRVSVAGGHILNIRAKLDERRTDIDKDKFGVDAAFDLANVSFQKGIVAAKVKADLQVLKESKAMPHGGFRVKGKVDLAADPVAFMKFAAEKMHQCEKAAKTKGVDRLVAQAHCDLSKQLLASQTLGDMKEAFVGMRREMVSSLSDFVTAATGELAAVQNDVVRQEMAERVKRARNFLKASEEASITDVEGGFMVEVSDIDVFGGLLEMDKARVLFTADHVHMEKALTIKAGSVLYSAAKPEIKKLLAGLEAQDECAMNAVIAHMNIRLNLLNAMID